MRVLRSRFASCLCAGILFAPLSGLADEPQRDDKQGASEGEPARSDSAPAKPDAKSTAAEKASDAASSADESAASLSRITQLIKQLGDDDFFVRERAQQELAQVGVEAFDALSEAENQPDLEIADRARYLVRSMNLEWTTENEPPEVKRKLENYGSQEDKKRESIIDELGELPDGQGIGVLARLVRFERSTMLSKRAALKIINQKPVDQRHWAARAAAIREGIGHSPRTAARWLVTYLASHEGKGNPPGAWALLADEETRTLHDHPDQSRPNLIIGLWRQEVDNLERLGRPTEAEAAMRRMAAIDPEDNDSLNDMLNWLVEHKAWAIVDEAARKYSDRFEQEPLLLYTLAQACAAQGNSKLAAETAERAQAQCPGSAAACDCRHQAQGPRPVRVVGKRIPRSNQDRAAGPLPHRQSPELSGRNAARRAKGPGGGRRAERGLAGDRQGRERRPVAGRTGCRPQGHALAHVLLLRVPRGIAQASRQADRAIAQRPGAGQHRRRRADCPVSHYRLAGTGARAHDAIDQGGGRAIPRRHRSIAG